MSLRLRHRAVLHQLVLRMNCLRLRPWFWRLIYKLLSHQIISLNLTTLVWKSGSWGWKVTKNVRGASKPAINGTSCSFNKTIEAHFKTRNMYRLTHPGPILMPLWAEMKAASGRGVLIESMNSLSNRYCSIFLKILIPGTTADRAAIAKHSMTGGEIIKNSPREVFSRDL